MTQSRQLAVIMFTDIVGYTSLMGSNEKRTFEILHKNRAIHQTIINQHNGTLIKELGDGIMARFSTATEAVSAAVSIQEECVRTGLYQLRIGMHLGEIVLENGDVFGDGVNIASRIEGMASPNGIFVSESIHQNVLNKEDVNTRFVSEQSLKNVSSPIKIYEVVTAANNVDSDRSAGTSSKQTEKSIAVLPFVNMSNDPSQEYFCDGISEEIIDTLAQLDNLRVIARTSAFSFKEKNVDVREIGKILDAETLLEGSVRKSGEQLRITTKLLSVSNGSYLWTRKYDRKLEDVFAIQEDIASCVATELKGYLSNTEKEILQPQKTNPEAYQHFLKGRQYFHLTHMRGARDQFEMAIAIDPDYTPAYAALATIHCYLYDWWGGNQSDLSKAEQLSLKALSLSPEMAECHVAYAYVLSHLDRVPEAEEAFKKAIQLNPRLYDAYYLYGRILFMGGRLELSAEMFRKAAEVRIEDFQSLVLLAQVLRDLDRPEAEMVRREAMARLDRQLELDPLNVRALSLGASSFYETGQKDKAMGMIDKALELAPEELTVVYNGACLFARAGEKERAIDLLEVAMKKGFGHKEWIESDSDYDSLRDDPRYKELMKNI